MLAAMCALGAAVCPAQDGAPGAGERRYLFYEAEDAFTDRARWLTQNWFSPSGGLWLYGNVDRGTPKCTIQMPHEGPWLVWVRVWDWEPDIRECVLAVNGEESYVCGGRGMFQWIWYHAHLVHSTELECTLIGTDRLDAMVDCLAVSNDPSWVPPHEMVNGKAYVSDAPYERLSRRAALIWTRAPLDRMVTSGYRRGFLLQGDEGAANAVVEVGGLGVWQLWLNGREMAQGDQGSGAVTVDLRPGLRPGRNALCIELSAIEMIGVEALPGVWLDGGIETADGWTLNLCTSPGWRSAADPPEGWLGPDFDDSQWERPLARAWQEPFAAP